MKRRSEKKDRFKKKGKMRIKKKDCLKAKSRRRKKRVLKLFQPKRLRSRKKKVELQ